MITIRPFFVERLMISFDYMHWAKTKSHAPLNLCKSDVANVGLEDLHVDWSTITLNGDNVYGHPGLVARIAGRFGISEDGIVLTTGASFSNYLVFAALLQPGDEVIVEKPTYEVLMKTPDLFHANTVRIERPMSNGFQPRLEELKRKITGNTRLIVFTNRHNPTGVSLSSDFINDLVNIVDGTNIYVLFDEVYLEADYSARPAAAVTLCKNFITTSSLTKAFGLSSLRCGWILCHPALAERMKQLNNFMNVVGSFVTEQLACLAFDNMDELSNRLQPIVRNNYTTVRDMLQKSPNIDWVDPGGGLVAFPRYLGGQTETFIDAVKAQHGISLVPGRFFEEPDFFRIAWANSSEIIKKACLLLGEFMQ